MADPHLRLEELLETLPRLQEIGSLSLTTKNQITLPKDARDAAAIDSLVYVWASPELGMLLMVGQRRAAAEHLAFMTDAD